MTDRSLLRRSPAGNGDRLQSDGPREARRVERRDVDREQGEPLAVGERRVSLPRSTPQQARPLSEWTTRPRILVTNDDGIESRGLLALKQALDPLGKVYVLAPETNQSAVGHTKTFMRPLRVRERTLAAKIGLPRSRRRREHAFSAANAAVGASCETEREWHAAACWPSSRSASAP